MPKKVYILCAFTLCCFSLIGQPKEFVESHRLAFNEKSSFLLGFDNRRSLLGSENVRILGIRFGFDYGKIKLYEGLYFLQEPIVERRVDPFQPLDTFVNQTRFSYLSTTLEFVFHKKKHWEFSVPVQLGLGSGEKKRFLNDSLISESSPGFIPAEVAINGMYKFTDWLALSSGVGYRISLLNTNEFDGTFYSFGLKVFLGKLYRSIKN